MCAVGLKREYGMTWFGFQSGTVCLSLSPHVEDAGVGYVERIRLQVNCMSMQSSLIEEYFHIGLKKRLWKQNNCKFPGYLTVIFFYGYFILLRRVQIFFVPLLWPGQKIKKK